MSTTGSEEGAPTTIVASSSGLEEIKRKNSQDGKTSLGGSITRMSRDESSMGSISNSDQLDDTDYNLPPGRINAVKGHHRLQGSGSNIMSLMHSRPTGNETPRSRSVSPSMKDRATGTTTGYSTSITHDANSSISSCDDIDSDILTDRAGFSDELTENIRRMHNSRDQLNLPPTVNERMTEDTLEDIHAFSEVQVRTRSSNASLVSGVSSVANEGVLEPCMEGEEDDSDYSDDDTGGDGYDGDKVRKEHRKKSNHPTIILTNIENLNLHHQQILEEEDDGVEDEDDDDNVNGQRAGDCSTLGDGEGPLSTTKSESFP
jgi:hypothetical protein